MPKAEAEGGVPEGAEAGEGVGGVLLSIPITIMEEEDIMVEEA